MKTFLRFHHPVNLAQFAESNVPILAFMATARPPEPEQHILRMLVQSPYSGGLQLPGELQWLGGEVFKAQRFHRENFGIVHPYTYVTVRHGIVSSRTDDEWHVDGFSMRYTHLPEANYVFTLGPFETEWLEQSFQFPDDFDPLLHNVHHFFQRRAASSHVRELPAGCVHLIDPYVVHRRPPAAIDSWRTFVRISLTPIEIPDVNNTVNPLISTAHYTLDGVRDFRDSLLDYDVV